jgi:SAM-dependent methyltransferase
MNGDSTAQAALVAYEALAAVYDDVTADHDYEGWTATLERLARRHGLRGTLLLDAACGTGKSFLPALRRGWDVTGVDLSPAMLAVARAKAPGVELVEADVRALPARLARDFDWITLLDDVVNYLLEPDDVASCMTSLARCARPGGLLLLDANTLLTYRSTFAADRCMQVDGTFVAWQGQAASTVQPGDVAQATVEVFVPEDGHRYRRVTSVHRQRHHPEQRLRRALCHAGFDVVAVYGQDATGAIEAEVCERRHTKALFIARRQGAPTAERR